MMLEPATVLPLESVVKVITDEVVEVAFPDRCICVGESTLAIVVPPGIPPPATDHPGCHPAVERIPVTMEDPAVMKPPKFLAVGQPDVGG